MANTTQSNLKTALAGADEALDQVGRDLIPVWAMAHAAYVMLDSSDEPDQDTVENKISAEELY